MLMLHISDIHFKHGEVGEPDDPNRGLRDDVIQDVKHMRDRLGPPGMILLSGDIAYAGRKDEYDFAYSWLEKELCPAAQCPIENVFVIPGNHDVDLKAEDGPGFKAARRDLRATAAGQIDNELRKWLRDPSSSGILFSPLENYNRYFAAKLLCAIGPYNVKGPDGEIVPNVSKPFVTRDIELNDRSILRLSGFNSVLVSDLSDAENSMLVDPAAAQITRDDGVAHLVMCHHPFGWIKNRGPFEDRMNGVVQLQLFGHEHTERVEENKYFVRIRAGALQPERDAPNWKPGYNWIDVSTTETDGHRKLVVKVWVRGHEVDHFIAITDRNHNEVRENTFDLPPWRRPEPAAGIGQNEREDVVLEVVPQVLELPMVEPAKPATVRSVTTKIFRLKEHEQRRLIAKLKLDETGDNELKDYEVVVAAVRRSAERGQLQTLDNEIDTILAGDGGR
jgi:hypothetical protein